MADREVQKRLAAILAADIAGYTRLIEADSDGTVAAWHSARADVIDPGIAEFNGRIVKHTGDGFLAEFPTAQDAVRCAVAMQEGLVQSSLEFRIGVNLGDIIDDGEDIHGEGVNVAARLEGLAEPGGICISGETHALVRNRVDVPFRDLGEHSVKHVTHPVHVYAIGVEQPVEVSGAGADAEDGRPSIAVLPFDNLSGDPEQEYFSDGITEDIITDLSKVSGLFVIARNSTFTYKGRAVDVKQVAAEMAVRYVVEGSVRKAGGRVRITAQLIDGSTGGHVWAERYDRDLDDIFEVQDEVTRNIVDALKVALNPDEDARIGGKGTDNMEAYDYALRGRDLGWRFTPETNLEAAAMLRKAIELDPEYAMPYTFLAMGLSLDYLNGWNGATRETLDECLYLAERAQDLIDTDPQGYWAMAVVCMWRGDLDRALAEIERAIALEPNLAVAHAIRSNILGFAGQPAEAVENLQTAMRLDPQYPDLYLHFLGHSHLLLGDYEAATEHLTRRIRRYPETDSSRMLLASCYGHLGQFDAAKNVWQELKQAQPDFTAEEKGQVLPYKNPADWQRILDGLELAGLAENAEPSLSDKPSVAVLPFDNLSGDPEQEYFSDGITEDIITALSRIRQFFVIARNTTFTYKGQAVDVKAVASDLGVRYVLEGSVRKAGNRVRNSAQLIDGESGNHIWAETYDRELEDIFAVQDEITQAVAGGVGPELRHAEAARAKIKSPENLGAWDFCQRGLAQYYQRPTPTNTKEAIQNFKMTIELDGSFALPWAGIARAMYRQILQGFDNTPQARAEIVRAGREAVKLDNQDAVTHTALCGAYMVTRQHGKAIQEGEIACELNPNYFHGIFWTGAALIWSGEPAKGIPFVEQALKISPRDPSMGQALSRLAEAHISLGDFGEAVPLSKRAVTHPRAGIWPEATLVAALALAGEDEGDVADARTAVLERMPGFSCAHFRDNFPATDPHFIEVYVEGLRKAGMPES